MPSPDTASTQPNDPSAAKLTTNLLLIAGVTAIVGFAAFFAAWLQASIDPGPETLKIAAKQYGLGNYRTANSLAERVKLPEDAKEELLLLREYVIGASLANQALPVEDVKERRALLHVAIPHLKAAAKDWPTGRQDDGNRLLGLSLFHVGDFAAAIAPMRSAVDRNPASREDLIPPLSQAYLYGEKSSASEALAMLDQINSPSLSPVALRDEVAILRAQCMLRLSQFQDARQVLRALDQRLAESVVDSESSTFARATKVSMLLAVADVSEAIERFGKGSSTDSAPRADVIAFLGPATKRLLLLRRDAPPDIANQASLWAARAYASAGQPSEALALFTSVRQQQPFEAGNIAAGIEEIEWLVDAGNGEEAVQTVRYLLREIGNEKDYDGVVVDLPSFRSRLIAALQTLRQKEQFESCIEIARTMSSLFPPADAFFEEAITHQQAAERALASSGSVLEVAPAVLALAKQKHRAAGDAFLAAAKLRFDTDKYCETLWQSIEAYQASGQFKLCVELLNDYLRYEDRRRHPRALLALGKANLATGDFEPALASLDECITQFARDPLRYDARLQAANAHAEANRFTEAASLLDENLTEGELTPQSVVWRDSLFTLGELMFRQCNETHLKWGIGDPTLDPSKPRSTVELRERQPLLEEAILKLNEAYVRYSGDPRVNSPKAAKESEARLLDPPRAMHAYYLNARAHKLAAVWPKLESKSVDALDAAKRQLRIQAEQHLSAALTGFANIRSDLIASEEEKPLTQTQEAILRNAYIAEADTLFDLGRFDEAAEGFRAVSLRYMNSPPALEALMGQARCLRQLNRQREARMVIRQAGIVLARIPPESDQQFLATTRYDRNRWKELLTWLDARPMPEDTDV